ncbi:unnamed protein product [Chrysodeixis includens]|uniref:Lipocalin/cytosolic fatty-acid binding domain-containing protein n=1 Tax=Chrysodeixis includens TaxID=689277 RepID=A0A9N8L4N3_CHRIL|nr:unnamed protein product [Chrysodeixis includens]
MQFGHCAVVQPMALFEVDKFTGQWFVIERFPNWYENDGACAYQRIQYCARTVAIEHAYVKDGIQYILHMNSSYTPGAAAVFGVQENSVDLVGMPLTIVTTDYSNYAVVHGCRYDSGMRLKYISAWILSREPTLPEDLLSQARTKLTSIPYANVAYLKPVDQSEDKCKSYWTAHVTAVNINKEELK